MRLKVPCFAKASVPHGIRPDANDMLMSPNAIFSCHTSSYRLLSV